MTNESKLAMFDKWTETRDKEEYLRLGEILFPTATREEMSDLFDESRAGYLHEQEGSEKAKKPHILTDEEAMDCVIASALGMSYEELKQDMEESQKGGQKPAEQMKEQLKLWRKYLAAKSESEQEALLKQICPGITSEGLAIMRRKMPEPGEPINKGISQEAINTLLDLSLTTEEALAKSAEITIKEAEKRPTLDDFFEATERQEKEAILQKMYGGTLTKEELEAFFPKDDD